MNKYQLRNLFETNMVPVLNLKKLLHPIVQDSIYGSFVGESVVTHDVRTPEKKEDLYGKYKEDFAGKVVNGRISENAFDEPFHYLDENGNEQIKQNDSNTTRIELTGVLTPEFDLFLHEIQRYLCDEFLFDSMYNVLLTDNEKNDRLENACSFLGFGTLKNAFVKLSSTKGVDVAFELLEDLVMYRKLATTDSWKKIFESYLKTSSTSTGILDISFAEINRHGRKDYISYPNNAPIVQEEILLALRKGLEEYLIGNVEANVHVESRNKIKPINQIGSFSVGKAIQYEEGIYSLKSEENGVYTLNRSLVDELVGKDIQVIFTSNHEDISFNRSNVYIKVLSSNSFELINKDYQPYLNIGEKIYCSNLYSEETGFSAFTSISNIIGDTFYIANTFESNIIGNEIKITIDACIENLIELNDIKTLSRLESISDFTPYIKVAVSNFNNKYPMTYDMWCGRDEEHPFTIEDQKSYLVSLFKEIRKLSLNFDDAISICGNFPYDNYPKPHVYNRYLASKNFSENHITLDKPNQYLYRYGENYNSNIDTNTYLEKLTTYEHVDKHNEYDDRIYASKLGATESDVMLLFGAEYMLDVNNQSMASVYSPKSLLEITGVNNGLNTKNINNEYTYDDLFLNFAVFSENLAKLDGNDEITHIILGNATASQYDFNYKKFLVPDKYGAAIYGKSVYKEESKKFNMSDINFSSAIAKFPVLQTISNVFTPISEEKQISSNVAILIDFEQYFNHMNYADLSIFEDTANENSLGNEIATFNTYEPEFDCVENRSLNAKQHNVTNDLSLILNTQNKISNTHISINVLIDDMRYYNLAGNSLLDADKKLKIEFRNYGTTVRMPIKLLGPSMEDYCKGMSDSELQGMSEYLSPFNTDLGKNIFYISFTEENVKYFFMVENGGNYYGTIEYDKAFLRLIDWTIPNDRVSTVFAYQLQKFVDKMNSSKLSFNGLKKVDPILNSDEVSYKIQFNNLYTRALVDGENKIIKVNDEEPINGDVVATLYEEKNGKIMLTENKSEKEKMKYLSSSDEYYKDFSLVRLEEVTDDFLKIGETQTQELTDLKYFRIKDSKIREKIRFGSSTNVISENNYKLLNISSLKGTEEPRYFSNTRKLYGVVSDSKNNSISFTCQPSSSFGTDTTGRIKNSMNLKLNEFINSVDVYPKTAKAYLQSVKPMTLNTDLAQKPSYYNFATKLKGQLVNNTFTVNENQSLSPKVLNQFYELIDIQKDGNMSSSKSESLYKIVTSTVENNKHLSTMIYKKGDVYEFVTYVIGEKDTREIQNFKIDFGDNKQFLKDVVYLSENKIAISCANTKDVGTTTKIYEYNPNSSIKIVNSALSASTLSEKDRRELAKAYSITTPNGVLPIVEKENGQLQYGIPYAQDKQISKFFIYNGRTKDVFAISYEDNTIDLFFRAPNTIKDSNNYNIAGNIGLTKTELWYKKTIENISLDGSKGYESIKTNFKSKYNKIINGLEDDPVINKLISSNEIDAGSITTDAQRQAFIEAAKVDDPNVKDINEAIEIINEKLKNGSKEIAYETTVKILEEKAHSEAEKVAVISAAFRDMMMDRQSTDDIIEYVSKFIKEEDGELKFKRPEYVKKGDYYKIKDGETGVTSLKVLVMFGEILKDGERFSADEIVCMEYNQYTNADNFDISFIDFENSSIILSNLNGFIEGGSTFEVSKLPFYSDSDELGLVRDFQYPLGKFVTTINDTNYSFSLTTSKILSVFCEKLESRELTVFTYDRIRKFSKSETEISTNTGDDTYKYQIYKVGMTNSSVSEPKEVSEGNILKMYENIGHIPFSRISVGNNDSYQKFDDSIQNEGNIQVNDFDNLGFNVNRKSGETSLTFLKSLNVEYDKSFPPMIESYDEENNEVKSIVFSNVESLSDGEYTFIYKTTKQQRDPYLGSNLTYEIYEVYNLDEALFIEEQDGGKKIGPNLDKNKKYYNYDGDSVQSLKNLDGNLIYRLDKNKLSEVASNFDMNCSSLMTTNSYVWPTVDDVIANGDLDLLLTPGSSKISPQEVTLTFEKDLKNLTSKLTITFLENGYYPNKDEIIEAYISSDEFKDEDLGHLPYVEREDKVFNVNDSNKNISKVYLGDYGRTKANKNLTIQSWNKESLFGKKLSKNKNGNLIEIINANGDEITNFGSKEFDYIEGLNDINKVKEVFDFEKSKLLQTRRENNYEFSHLFLTDAGLTSASAYSFAKQLDNSLIYSVNLDSIENQNRDNILGQYTTYNFRNIYYNSEFSNFGFHINRFLVEANKEDNLEFDAYLVDESGKKYKVSNFHKYLAKECPFGSEIIDGFSLSKDFGSNILTTIYGTNSNDSFSLKIVAKLNIEVDECFTESFKEIFEINVDFNYLDTSSNVYIMSDRFDICPTASAISTVNIGELEFDRVQSKNILIPFKITTANGDNNLECKGIEIQSSVSQYESFDARKSENTITLDFELNSLSEEDEIEIAVYGQSNKLGNYTIHLPIVHTGKAQIIYREDEDKYFILPKFGFYTNDLYCKGSDLEKEIFLKGYGPNDGKKIYSQIIYGFIDDKNYNGYNLISERTITENLISTLNRRKSNMISFKSFNEYYFSVRNDIVLKVGSNDNSLTSKGMITDLGRSGIFTQYKLRGFLFAPSFITLADYINKNGNLYIDLTEVSKGLTKGSVTLSPIETVDKIFTTADVGYVSDEYKLDDEILMVKKDELGDDVESLFIQITFTGENYDSERIKDRLNEDQLKSLGIEYHQIGYTDVANLIMSGLSKEIFVSVQKQAFEDNLGESTQKLYSPLGLNIVQFKSKDSTSKSMLTATSPLVIGEDSDIFEDLKNESQLYVSNKGVFTDSKKTSSSRIFYLLPNFEINSCNIVSTKSNKSNYQISLGAIDTNSSMLNSGRALLFEKNNNGKTILKTNIFNKMITYDGFERESFTEIIYLNEDSTPVAYAYFPKLSLKDLLVYTTIYDSSYMPFASGYSTSVKNLVSKD